MDWCVKPRGETNHRPSAVLNGRAGWDVQRLEAKPGKVVELDAHGSSDPDEDALTYEWFVYGEAGTYAGEAQLAATGGPTTRFTVPDVGRAKTIHVILRLKDDGEPSLIAYRRVVVTIDRQQRDPSGDQI